MGYPGRIEFVFVAESESDPAVPCAREAIAAVSLSPPERSARVEISGLSYHNAQKIHNMLYGVASASSDSQFVLFADDDVYFYPSMIEELVDPLIREKASVLVSTGYEFICPPPGGSVWTYCLFTYRMHNLWSFITDRPILCWGGCWMGPLSMFRTNYGSLVDCYLDGGYSDDTIVSCLAQQNGFVCAHPRLAIFPNLVDANTTFSRYWDFVRRQFFVTDTYATAYNRSIVHSLAWLICSSICLMVIWMCVCPWIGALALVAAATSEKKFVWGWTATLGLVDWVLWAVMLAAIQFFVTAMVDATNCQRPPEQRVSCVLNRWKLALGLAIHCFFMPIAVIAIMLSNSIVWAGVRYYKKDGKICKVERRDRNGQVRTELASASIARTLRNPRFKRLLQGSTFE
jgi:hypothetical protein